MASEKAMAALFGSGELALRLLPCLAGIGAIVATFVLARRLAGEAAAWLAAALLALSASFLAYAHQLKHYTYDALFTVLLILLYEAYAASRTRRSMIAFVAIACVSFGFSFTTPFVLAGIAAAELIRSLSERRGPDTQLAAGFAIAGAVFVALFFVAHSGDVTQPNLQAYFVEAWLPLGVPSELPRFLVRQIANILELAGSPSAVAVVLILGAGLVAAARSGRAAIAWTFGVAVTANLVASALHLYPFGDTRTSLYLAPLVCCLVATGLAQLLTAAAHPRLALVAFLGLAYPLFGFPAIGQVKTYLTTGRPVENIRDAATLVASRAAPGDGIVVTETAIPPFIYYWYRAGRGATVPNAVWLSRHRKDPEVNAPPVRDAAAKHDAIWCYFYRVTPAELAVLRGALAPTHERREQLMSESEASLEVYRRR
jgi:uncharacterized membrane protein